MNLARAVASTIAYADFFKFPLFPKEIHHWLISSEPVSFVELKEFLPKRLSASDRQLRSETSHFSEQKISHARRLVAILKYVPGLRLVALTGSVAAKNSKKDDDIDLLFVTSPNALWLVRPLVIALIALFFRRRHPLENHHHVPNSFCPNLWLDTLSLSIPMAKQSLYVAHEALQILPLLDRGGVYHRFLKANFWIKKYLANAYTSSLRGAKRRGNLTLSRYSFSSLLAPLNYLFYLIQLLYMHPKRTSETVHLHGAFLHTTDFSGRLDNHLSGQNKRFSHL